MRLAGANDSIFDTLMTPNDKTTFNLFDLIKQNGRAFIATDDSTYIFAQNSRRAPSWLFLKEKPEGATLDELVSLVSGMVKLNALFKINTVASLSEDLLKEVSRVTRVPFTPEVEMEVFVCNKSLPCKCCDGKMITPREEHREIIKDFVVGMIRESAGLTFDADDSEKFTSALLSSQSFYLWENDDGKIVSMARLAHKTGGYARLNAIYTDVSMRGQGYTKMLISQITESLLADGLIPLIYSDRLIKDLNNAYKLIGYEKTGEITQFAFNH